MDFSADRNRLNTLARKVLDWAAGGSPDASTHNIVREAFGFAIGEEELLSVRARLEKDDRFLAWRADLVSRWRDRMASPRMLSEAEARALLGELAENFDHALLYEHDLLASSTYMRRGESNSRDLRMPGTMPCWTVHFTTRGGALFVSRDAEISVRPGSLMFMRPQAAYHYGLHPRETEWEHLWALFQPRSNWSEFLGWIEPGAQLACLGPVDENLSRRIESLFRDLIALGEERGPYLNELRYNKLEEILIRARMSAAASRAKALDLRIQRACDYMQERLEQRFSVDEVAAELNLSTSRFAHLFAAQMGVAPKAWINDMRLQRARKLLLHTGDSIAGIGAQVGYEDPAHFARNFKKSMGYSPRQFRRSFAG